MKGRRIGYFCTAGYTETGGILPFLRKLDPTADWQRCFPAVNKPAPKLGRSYPTPVGQGHGATGDQLRVNMLRILREHHRGDRCALDLVVLVDDADCRPASQSEEALRAYGAEVTRAVREATEQPELACAVLLAFPEVEAWLLADWDEGFGRYYKDIAVPLRRRLWEDLLAPRGLSWEQLEDYGGAPQGGSCAHKLSEDIQGVMQLQFAGRGYSKRMDGPPILMGVRPDKVAARCPLARRCFAAFRGDSGVA